MDKSVAAKLDKVSNYIPDDLSFSFLSKLPLKSLKRFGSVCKSWSILFENPIFMSMYRINFLSKNHAFYDDTSLLLHQETHNGHYYHYTKCELYSISGDRFENRVKLDWPNPFQEEDDEGFNISGSCSINGIFSLRRAYGWDFIFWNPATKEFKVIPNSPIESNPDYYIENCIFGYDRVRDDYKLIRHAIRLPMGDTPYDSSWEIFSLRSNTWKKVNGDVPRCIDYQHAFMDGVSHWWSKLETDNTYLVSFDFNNEIFLTTPIPSDIIGENFDFRQVCRNLLVLNGFIALIVNYTETNTFHISILGEVGAKNSWTKLFIVGLSPCIDSLIGAWKNGYMFFKKKDGKLACFDLKTNMIEELGIIIKNRSRSKIVIYKESYLPIGGIND